ncbi:MAG: hypothetical protein IJK81_01760 [Selenomonadaceae bacterium]|nr:hypothetical protein [Selenomonadaceae bacterium]
MFQWLKKVCKFGMNCHYWRIICRTTDATLMDDAEVPLKIKQMILGHSAPRYNQ